MSNDPSNGEPRPAADVRAQYEAEKARHEAAEAEAKAEKVARELKEWRSEPAVAQREAERKQKTARANKEARADERALAPELEDRKQQAAAIKDIAEAEAAAVKSDQAKISALLPDLSNVARAEMKVSGDQGLFGAALANDAMGAAAESVHQHLGATLTEKSAVLITDDPDLASTDGIWLEVSSGLKNLNDAAGQLLKERDPVTGQSFGAAAGAVSAAIPGILSLLTPTRTLSSRSVAANSAAALSFVAGQLERSTSKVVIDSFRLTPADGELVALETRIRNKESSIRKLKIDLEQKRIENELAAQGLDDDVRNLKEELENLAEEDGQERSRLSTKLGNMSRTRAECLQLASESSVKAVIAESVLKAIDQGLAAVHAVPEGTKRSAFVAASLREGLHPRGDADPVFSHVLFVQSSAGSSDQVIDDRPLWGKDRFHVVGTANITFWLLDTSNSRIVAAGTSTGIADVKGKIGHSISAVETSRSST